MATKILMEALSPTMEEGRLVEWKKKEGDAVALGDVLAEVETDKAVMEIVARSAGTLLKQIAAAGATVPVSQLVGWIGQPGEALADGAPAPTAADASGPVVSAAPPPGTAASPKAAATPASDPGSSRVKASPLARKIAADQGLNLASVAGSGPEGRIIKRDLDAVNAARPASAPSRPSAGPSWSVSPAGPGLGYTDVPLTQIRKTIAKRLAQSIGPIPTFYLTTEVDMERMWEARASLNAAGEDQSKISFNDIIMKALATALIEHPACNAWWQDDHIRYWNDVHISMAVAIPDGLITPVIRHADRKSLRQIGAEAKELAGRARNRKLMPEEYTGGTFSISNLGMFDIDEFTAVINPPEAGILAVGRIAERPAVVDGAIAIRRRLRLTMSCDHRVIDGATGAAFLKTLKLFLENPLALVW